MKWRGKRQSGNIEDRRGTGNRGRKVALGGGAVGIIILLFQIFGGDTGRQLVPVLEQLNQQTQVQQRQTQSRELTAEEKEIRQFVDVILTSTDEVWTQLFRKYNLGSYQRPTLVLFSGATQSACGGASAATGPFYCPADRKVYIDMNFFKKLRTDFGAKGGDFAIAYVIAHEIGHHVQTLLGISQKVQRAKQGNSRATANKYSVALELQADFYSGLWAHYSKDYLEVDRSDIEEAMDAARAVGDDAIQKRTQGYVVPDSFTHGSSKKRMKWFLKGFQSGDLRQHDTFSEELQ